LLFRHDGRKCRMKFGQGTTHGESTLSRGGKKGKRAIRTS